MVFESGLQRALRRLTDAGSEVVLVEVVPKPWAVDGDLDTRACSDLLLVLDPQRCRPAPFSADNEVTLRANQLERRAAAASGAVTWSFSGALCPDGVCSQPPDQPIIWSEPQHLTREAAAGLAPLGAERLAELTG